MAKIPEYKSSVAAPRSAGTVRINLDPSSGLGEIAKALGGYADIAERAATGQAVADLQNAKALWARKHADFEEELKGNQDWTTYVDNYDKMVELAKDEMVGLTRSGLSRRAVEDFVQAQSPSARRAVAEIAFSKRADIETARVMESVTEFERLGNKSAAEAALAELAEEGLISHKSAATRRLEVNRNVDWYFGLELADFDPATLMEMIGEPTFLEELNPEDRARLKYRAESNLASAKRERAAQIKVMQEQTAAQFLADLWENRLIDPQEITDALRLGYINDTDAKYLRDALLNPEPPETDLVVYAQIRQSLDEAALGAKTTQDVLSEIFANLDRLSPEDGKAFAKMAFDLPNKHDASMRTEGRKLMEELIREKSEISGLFTDDEREIVATAEAVIELDETIEEAVRRGKPLSTTELLAEAVRIGMKHKREVSEEREKEAPIKFEPGITAYPRAGQEMMDAARKVIEEFEGEQLPPSPDEFPDEMTDYMRMRRVWYLLPYKTREYIRTAFAHNKRVGKDPSKRVTYSEILADPTVRRDILIAEKKAKVKVE